ncbi:MAG TPA: hypothetical protein VGN57_19855 [Pirellulaceae bacterium]|jgi:hypothetical protein|nr:hypothetical protein [Pirellulaceae bacterium]
MNARDTRRRTLATTLAACTASLSIAGAAMAQAPGAPPQGALQQPVARQGAPQQGVMQQGAVSASVQTTQSLASSSVQTVVEDVTPDAGLALGQISIGRTTALADAGHVIDMLMEQRMFGSLPEPQAPAMFAGFDAFGRPRFVQPQMSDLVPVSIRAVQEGTPVAGPIYAITVNNCGDLPAGRFRVSLVAALGSVEPLSPTAVVVVEQLAAGESVRVDVQLPLSSMAMGGAATVQPFDTAIVAIDGFDEMPERNELNNLLALQRSAIAPLVAVVTQTLESTETTIQEETLPAGAPAPLTSTGPASPDAIPPSMRPTEAGPGEIETPAPPKIDDGALDELSAPEETEEMRQLFR